MNPLNFPSQADQSRPGSFREPRQLRTSLVSQRRNRDFEVSAQREVCLFRITLPRSTVHEFPFYTPVSRRAIIRDSGRQGRPKLQSSVSQLPPRPSHPDAMTIFPADIVRKTRRLEESRRSCIIQRDATSLYVRKIIPINGKKDEASLRRETSVSRAPRASFAQRASQGARDETCTTRACNCRPAIA